MRKKQFRKEAASLQAERRLPSAIRDGEERMEFSRDPPLSPRVQLEAPAEPCGDRSTLVLGDPLPGCIWNSGGRGEPGKFISY